MAPMDAEDDTTAELFSCGICDDLMLDPVTLGCCGRSFCRRCLRQWLRTSVHTAGVPRCPGGCTRKLPFRLPSCSVALRGAMEHLVPERLAQRRKEAEELGETQDEICFGGFKAWQEVAANRDVVFGANVGVRQGTPGILVGNFHDGRHVTVRFDEREDGSELCVNVLPGALMAPLPGGFRLGQRVVSLHDLLLDNAIGVRLGTGGAVAGSAGEERLMICFDSVADDNAWMGPSGPVSVSFREVTPERMLAGGYRIAQQVQAAMDLVVGARVVVCAGTRGSVLAEFSDTRLTVAFGHGRDAQSCFNVLPVELQPWCEPPSGLPVGSKVHATKDVFTMSSTIMRAGTQGTVLGGVDAAQLLVAFEEGEEAADRHVLAVGLDVVCRTDTATTASGTKASPGVEDGPLVGKPAETL